MNLCDVLSWPILSFSSVGQRSWRLVSSVLFPRICLCVEYFYLSTFDSHKFVSNQILRTDDKTRTCEKWVTYSCSKPRVTGQPDISNSMFETIRMIKYKKTQVLHFHYYKQ